MTKIVDIKNLKSNETDMFLKQKMQEVGMDSQELARRLNVSPVTTYRWEKGERKISVEQSILIAEILKCEPENILFADKKIDTIELHSYAEDYVVRKLHKKNYRKIIIPGGFYTPQTKAIQFYAPGREAHNEIHLFERSGATEKGCRDVICLIEIDKTQTTFRLNLLHPETKKPISKIATNVDPRDIKIAAPRKMTFFESYNKYTPDKIPSNKINPFK